VNDIRETLAVIREKILTAGQKAGRRPGEVRLIAVTKRVDAEKIRAAAAWGVSDFGENYLQEARAKIEALEPGLTWHMIGHVQSNKAKYIPGLFSYVHSVDRWGLLEDLDRHEKGISILFEVNISGEPQKHGATPDALRSMLEKTPALRHIKPVGLMTVPPLAADPESTRPYFRRLRELLQQVNREFGMGMSELSMGMSADFEVAIQEGATMVRIGTAIFGERI
jgi:pyridoxal phosphate enzyme (YggS family)